MSLLEIKRHDIRVSTTSTGVVSIEAKDQALRIVRETPAVARVDNRLAVASAARQDAGTRLARQPSQTQVQQEGPKVTLLTPPEFAVLVLMLVAVAFWTFVSVVAPESRSADPPGKSLPSTAGGVWHC